MSEMKNRPWSVSTGKFICFSFIMPDEALLHAGVLSDVELIRHVRYQYVNEVVHNKKGATLATPFCSPSWTRTKDPLINSQML